MGCSSNCNCGCNKNISYGCNSSCNQSYSGVYFCKDPICYVKSDFVIPAANVAINIEVTDSSRLYVGAGIQIGTGYFQVTAITDTNNISIAHNGTATPNLQLTAIQPSYGCYQYPITLVGKVSLLKTPTVVALNDAMSATIDALSNITVQVLTYGYLGPKTVQFEAELNCDTINTLYWVGFSLPVTPASGSPLPAFSGFLDKANIVYGPAMLGLASFQNYAVIGLGNSATIAAGSTRRFRILGTYDV